MCTSIIDTKKSLFNALYNLTHFYSMLCWEGQISRLGNSAKYLYDFFLLFFFIALVLYARMADFLYILMDKRNIYLQDHLPRFQLHHHQYQPLLQQGRILLFSSNKWKDKYHHCKKLAQE